MKMDEKVTFVSHFVHSVPLLNILSNIFGSEKSGCVITIYSTAVKYHFIDLSFASDYKRFLTWPL